MIIPYYISEERLCVSRSKNKEFSQMSWTSPYIGNFPRKGSFPVRVSSVFYCNNTCFPVSKKGIIVSNSFEVCLQIIRELVKQRHPSPSWDTPGNRIKEAALYMLHHYDQAVNCDDIAARFGFSHAVFFREWKKYFDVSPSNYILEYRLQEAARRLAQTDIPVSTIVREVHFSGVTAFYKKFKEHYGMTPDFFRKEQRQKKLPIL